MYDYKNRQSDLSFSKPKGTWHKGLRRAIGLALTAGILYGIVQLALSWQSDSETLATDSNIIELQLPPHPEAGEQAQMTRPATGSLTDTGTNDR
jgi:hypothetical protein